VKSRRLSQPLKHDSEIVSIDEGRQMDRSDEQNENADCPRIESLEGVSNVKWKRVWQPLKHDFETISIDAGMQME
jgi:hypothetical protein